MVDAEVVDEKVDGATPRDARRPIRRLDPFRIRRITNYDTFHHVYLYYLSLYIYVFSFLSTIQPFLVP